MQTVGTLFEGPGEAAERHLEHGAHQQSECPALEFVGDEKIHVAQALCDRMERPAVLHAAEGSFEIFDQDLQIGTIERYAAGESFAHKLVGHRHVRNDDLDSLRFLDAPAHSEVATQWHEFGIAFDIGDQIEHVGCGMADAAPLGKLWHQACPSRDSGSSPSNVDLP